MAAADGQAEASPAAAEAVDRSTAAGRREAGEMLNEADRARVGAAVTRAEAASDGEIVTIVSARSDDYRDVPIYGAVAVLFLAIAVIAAAPAFFILLLDEIVGGWEAWTPGELIAILLGVLAIKFLVARWILALWPIRMILTPATAKTHRVRARALTLFRLAAENRTRAKTGVLLYLSLAEHRAEIVADASINTKVAPETWGAAMAALIEAVRDDRPADGMVAAIERIGHVLAEHFPRSPDDTNELPDRLILL
jgi:putative membrane protein